MRIEIINLEEKILANENYLLECYPNIRIIIEQISMILDFGMSNEIIVEWFRLNKMAIDTINKLLNKKFKTRNYT
jgi:hypothetical protein